MNANKIASSDALFVVKIKRIDNSFCKLKYNQQKENTQNTDYKA